MCWSKSSPAGLPDARRVAEGVDQVVPELERLADREAVVLERAGQVRPAGDGRAEQQRPVDRVVAGLAQRDPAGQLRVRVPLRGDHDVDRLADDHLGAQLVPDRAGGPATAPVASRSAQAYARSPARIATPSPYRRASPLQPCRSCSAAYRTCAVGCPRRIEELSSTSSCSSAKACSSSSAAAASTTTGIGRVAADGEVAAEAEDRPDPLAAGPQQRLDRVDRDGRVRGHRAPAGPLGGDEPVQPVLDLRRAAAAADVRLGRVPGLRARRR